MKLFVICAEQSGENIIKYILDKIKTDYQIENDRLEIMGIVSSDTATTFNIKQIFSPKELAMLGIGDILTKIPSLLDRITDTVNNIMDFQPDLIVSVDTYDFCIRVAKKVRKLTNNPKNISHNITMWHIVAPSVWAYWSGRAKTLSKYYDRLFYLLPFEKKYFKPLERKTTTKNKGFISTFIGYPATFQQNTQSLTKNNHLIGITIGSRKGEIIRHKDLIFNTILRLTIIDSKYRFIILATKDTASFLKKIFHDLKNVSVIDDDEEKHKIIQQCVLIIAKSGTNNIEIGALGTPMITYYKTSMLTYLFAKIFAKVKMINLYNITLGKKVIPELIQKEANPDNLTQIAYELLTDEAKRNWQLEQIHMAITLMQREDRTYPLNIVAEEIYAVIKPKTL